MYANYWGLAETPFRNTLDARWFYESPIHEEALARLLFLIENQRRCGVLSGPAGTGKSLILDILRREIARNAGAIARLDVCGRSSRELLWETAAEWGLCPGQTDGPNHLWRKLHDRVLANRYGRAPLVLLLDHLDRAQAECIGVVERLQHLSANGDTGLILIAVVRGDSSGRISSALREIADLRIELSYLDREQTELYVDTLLYKAGATRSLFEPAAIDRLYLETRGVPRELNRLCDLVLLAGMADNAMTIDYLTVAAAADELQVGRAHGYPAPHIPFGHAATPSRAAG
jgi:general secretion pathway protein A